MAVYAFGATSLIGGGSGALDAIIVSAAGDDPGISDGCVAIVCVQGDAVYHYIADADSGLDEDSPNIIKPDWQSSGVAYAGALRWILTKVYPMIRSNSVSGGYKIDNIYLDANKHLVIVYDETPTV